MGLWLFKSSHTSVRHVRKRLADGPPLRRRGGSGLGHLHDDPGAVDLERGDELVVARGPVLLGRDEPPDSALLPEAGGPELAPGEGRIGGGPPPPPELRGEETR